MVKSSQIPEAVWRVAMMTYHREIRRHPEQAWQIAIAAALTTWPGANIERFMPDSGPYTLQLPLPKEGGGT